MSEEHATTPTAAAVRECLNIPQNIILNGINKYSQQDQDDLLWLVGYVRSEKVGSKAALNEMLDCDYTTTYRILTGTYPAAIKNFMETVRQLRRKLTAPGAEFIETVVTRKIFKTLDLARNKQAVVHICGPSRRGKTVAVREWQRRNNHGRSIYIDCPVIGGIRALLVELAKKAGVDCTRKLWDISERVQKSFDWRHTIIVDEAVRLLPKRQNDVASLEFLRRLHDVAGCGLAFVSTNLLHREMESGSISAYLEQLVGRIEEPLIIPAKVSLSEAGDHVRHYNADASMELIRVAAKIANEKGKLGVLAFLLQDALLLARAKKESLNETHLQAAIMRRNNDHTWPED